MRKSNILFLSVTLLFFSFTSDESPKDYLHVGNKIRFNNKDYNLVWSENPSTGYFMQEYLPDGNSLENYHDMMLVEAIEGNITAENAAIAKVEELKDWKLENPVINWNVFKTGDERLIDFVVSDGGFIYEWNLYRYSNEVSKSGKHLVLYAYAYRDSLLTNADLKPFFDRIVENRIEYRAKLGELKLPKIKTK